MHCRDLSLTFSLRRSGSSDMFSSSRAASRRPTRRVVANQCESRSVISARPRATNQQLVRGGQGVCGLPNGKRGGERAERGLHRPETWEGAAALWPARSACAWEGPRQGSVGTLWVWVERTMNMFSKSVTLEVLKLSAWLKAVACCRVEGRAWGGHTGGCKRHVRRCAGREAGGSGIIAGRRTARAACGGEDLSLPLWCGV